MALVRVLNVGLFLTGMIVVGIVLSVIGRAKEGKEMKKVIDLLILIPCLAILVVFSVGIVLGAKASKTFETEGDEEIYGV